MSDENEVSESLLSSMEVSAFDTSEGLEVSTTSIRPNKVVVEGCASASATTSTAADFEFELFRAKIERSYKQIAVNRKMRKYYRKRYQLFARFDAGVLLDKESWYSVTPERTALHTARKCFATLLERLGGDKAAASSACVLDAFCGSGGNSIQLAKYTFYALL